LSQHVDGIGVLLVENDDARTAVLHLESELDGREAEIERSGDVAGKLCGAEVLAVLNAVRAQIRDAVLATQTQRVKSACEALRARHEIFPRDSRFALYVRDFIGVEASVALDEFPHRLHCEPHRGSA